jgi:uncharacterized protein
MMTRRRFFKWLGGLIASGAALGSYAFIIEPGFRLSTVAYSFVPPRWTEGLKLRVVVLSDPHLIEPHMPVSRWTKIIAQANRLDPDVVILLGDYVAGHFWRTGTVPVAKVAAAAKSLEAKIGVFGVCGNHDWWDDRTFQKTGVAPCIAQKAFEDVGIPMLENKAVRLTKDENPFWITGTSSIVAKVIRPGRFKGLDDLPGTLAQVTDDAPIIHLAHEPDLFVEIPDRVSLTLSGHTHGGQVRIFGYSPVTPSAFGNRFAYGHVVEEGRHLVVSGGLGCSILPVRFGVPPEITVLDLG